MNRDSKPIASEQRAVEVHDLAVRLAALEQAQEAKNNN
jgi:hypothetical protein